MVDVHDEPGREAGRLPLPVADQRHGAHQKCRRRTDCAVRGLVVADVPVDGFPFRHQDGEELGRLAQTHVVGQAGAEPIALQERQPGQAALLVRAQDTVETGRRRERSPVWLLPSPPT